MNELFNLSQNIYMLRKGNTVERIQEKKKKGDGAQAFHDGLPNTPGNNLKTLPQIKCSKIIRKSASQ